jgi:hypothetical protein
VESEATRREVIAFHIGDSSRKYTHFHTHKHTHRSLSEAILAGKHIFSSYFSWRKYM